jgi:hypothetical protein
VRFLAVSFVLSVVNLANGAPADYVPKDLVTTEVRDMDALVRALDAFIRRADPLDKKPQVPRAELDAVSADAEAVKRAIPQFQRGISSIMGKLQAAGKWSPELDTFVESRLKATGAPDGVLQDLRTNGGARAVLQNASGAVTGLAQAVDRNVTELRGKSIVSRLLEELLGKTAYASWSLRDRATACRIYLAAKIACSLGEQMSCHDAVFYGAICRGDQ